jgi:hypothetical protein
MDPEKTREFIGRLIERKPYTFLIILLLTALACRLTPDPTPQPATSSALAPGMQIGVVRTTVGGLTVGNQVDPGQAGGGMLITVQDVQPRQAVTVRWQRTVERVVPPDGPTPVVGVGTPEPTPVMEAITQEGRITGGGLDDAHAALLPIYWPQVETEATETSLMWLSAEAFGELKETRQTGWSADVLTRISNLPRWALDEIDEAAAERDILLTAEPEFVEFEVTVNGDPRTVQAIEAFDDFGNRYLILDDAENPLILKFTFNVVSTGAIGIDVGIWTLIKALFSGYQVVEIQG